MSVRKRTWTTAKGSRFRELRWVRFKNAIAVADASDSTHVDCLAALGFLSKNWREFPFIGGAWGPHQSLVILSKLRARFEKGMIKSADLLDIERLGLDAWISRVIPL